MPSKEKYKKYWNESNFTASTPSSLKYKKYYNESYVIKNKRSAKKIVTTSSTLLQGIVKKVKIYTD